jgi:hypothetical protein
MQICHTEKSSPIVASSAIREFIFLPCSLSFSFYLLPVPIFSFVSRLYSRTTFVSLIYFVMFYFPFMAYFPSVYLYVSI